MHQPPHPFESSKTTPVTAVTEIKISAYFKISAAQCALIRDPVQWLVWHVVLIKHCFNNRKREQNDSSSVDQQSRQKRKARASLSLKRLTAWDSIFGHDILQNPNIRNPAHPDGVKRRLRFRAPCSVLAAIVHMFTTKDGWNPVSASHFYGKPIPSHSRQDMCALFILGRGTDLDTVSMLSRISMGTHSSFFNHFCEKTASVFHEYVYMPAGDDLAAVLSLYTEMGFPGCVGSTDCVHFYWDRCPHNVGHLYLGKEGGGELAMLLQYQHLRHLRHLRHPRCP